MNKFQMWLKKDSTILWKQKQRHAFFTWPKCAEAKYTKHQCTDTLQPFVHSSCGAFYKRAFCKWAGVFEIYGKKKNHVMKTRVMARTFPHYSLPRIC